MHVVVSSALLVVSSAAVQRGLQVLILQERVWVWARLLDELFSTYAQILMGLSDGCLHNEVSPNDGDAKVDKAHDLLTSRAQRDAKGVNALL